MTEKEKARAYDEALKRAKEQSIDGYLDAIAVSDIFPELRESEDERIRKWIVNLLHELHYNQTAQPMALKAIEYLEKQKEPHYTKRNALFDKCVENCDPKVMKAVSDKVDEMLGKEQKPAEWSEEDEQLIGFIFDLLNDLVWRKDRAMSKEECLERLKSLRPSWKPSEEQIYSLGTVVKGYNECTVGSVGYHLKELYEQLKKLK